MLCPNSVALKETGEASGDKPMPDVEPDPDTNGERGEDDEEEEEVEEDTDSMDGSGLYSLTEDGERETDGDRRERVKAKDGKRAERKRNRPGSGNNNSSSSDDDDEEEHKDADDEDDDDEAMEAWLGAELCELRGPEWRAVPSLRSREIGRDSQQFVRRVCGARSLVQRLELQGRLERHTGCVNTLHFNPSGTRLASGSDDLRVVIWDWAVRRAELEFDSGHKSNVFQVRQHKKRNQADAMILRHVVLRAGRFRPKTKIPIIFPGHSNFDYDFLVKRQKRLKSFI